jgi:hypothetical protein
MASGHGRGTPPPRPAGRTRGIYKDLAKSLQDDVRELRARLADREAECFRLRQVIATGTEQYQHALQDRDGWRHEAIIHRSSRPERAVPPASTGEHLPTDAALITAQTDIIRLTERVAAAEKETVSAKTISAALHQKLVASTKSLNDTAFQFYRANADLTAERRSHEQTRGLLQLQPLVAAVAAQPTRPSTTVTLAAVSTRLANPPAPPFRSHPPPRAPYTPSTSPGPTTAGLLAMLNPPRAAAATAPRPLSPAPAPVPTAAASPILGRSPIQISSPVLGPSPPSSFVVSRAGSKPGSPDP